MSGEIFNIEVLQRKGLVFLVENKDDALVLIEKCGEQAISLGTGNTDKFLQYVAENKPKAHLAVCFGTEMETKRNLSNNLKDLNVPHTNIAIKTGDKTFREFFFADPEHFLNDVLTSRKCAEIDMKEDLYDTPEEELGFLYSIDSVKCKCKEANFWVDNLLEKNSLVGVIGESGVGKSFFVLDMLASISAEIPFHGRAVQKAPTFFIAAEGQNGLIKRNKAWNIGRWRNPDGRKDFFPITMALALPDEQMEKKLIDLIDGTIDRYNLLDPAVIVFDTLSRTFGGNENSNSDISEYIRCLDRIKQRYPGLTVIVVHHSGHGDKDRARGASALRCALDAEMLIQASTGPGGKKMMTVSCSKMKDAEEFPDLHFSMDPVEVFRRSDGRSETSLCLEELTEVQTSMFRDKLPARTRTALDTFREALQEQVKEKTEANKHIDPHEGLPLDAWRAAFIRRSTAGTPEGKRKAFERGKTDLLKLKILEVDTSDRYKLTDGEHEKAVLSYL